MRYFLIDRVTEIVVGERIRGVKAVSLTDEILHDHFPDHPVLPGMLVLEGAAQLAGFLLELSFDTGEDPVRRALLVMVESAKFHDTAGPGDLLEFEAVLDSKLPEAAKVKVEVSCEGRRVARARLTFVMKEILSEAVHEQRRGLYRLWTRTLESPPPIR